MKLQLLNLALLFSNSATADFLHARSMEHGNNVELGDLEGVNQFYSLIGHSFDPNNTYYWEDVTEFETFDPEGETESPNPLAPAATSLVPREDVCSDLTGITKTVCDSMPSRYWFWGAGGALLIYYSPRLLTNWLNDVGAAVQAGKALRKIWKDGSTGPNGVGIHDGLKRSDEDAIDYHFTLPYLLDANGKPERSILSRRSYEQGGFVADAELSHDYVFSEKDQTLYYKATRGSFSVPTQGNSTSSRLRARATSAYTIVMTVVKHTAANTIARPQCIGQLLKYHIDASSEKGRFACRPIDNRGAWHATMHLMINHGQRNTGTYGACCD